MILMRNVMLSMMLLLSLAGCAHQHHHRDTGDDKESKRKESDEERKERLEHEKEISQKQAAANAKFQKALVVARKIKPGEPVAAFYHQADDARLALEKVEALADGERERYSFMDNNTAFVIVLIKGDRVAEIWTEGVDLSTTKP